jgi:glycosyltransferase involved in cell wall biosynthesis
VLVLSGATRLVDQLESNGAAVLVLGNNGPMGRLVGLIRTPAAIRRLKPDLIQGWMVHGNLAAQIAGTLFNIPVLWGIRHSQLVSGQEKWLTEKTVALLKYLSKFPARIVYNSEAGKDWHARFGYEARRAVVIPNGFDLSAFRADAVSRAQTRKMLAASDNTVVVGMVARYHPVKGHATLLEAASGLVAKHKNILFVLAGSGCDQGNADLVASVNRLGLENHTCLLGERSDIPAVMNAFDIGVLSSSSEGFPNVVGELMACGVPCVVTNVGDSASLIGQTGLCVPAMNPSALAHALEKIISMDGYQRRRLGELARSRIANSLSLPSVARAYEALYSEVKLERT